MKILLIIYTGTNNTLYLANELKNNFNKLNHYCDIYNVTKDINTYDINSYDLIGLGYPIYAFNSPKYFETKIFNLNIRNKKYFIFKNSGEILKLNNLSSYSLYKHLEKNNNHLINEYHLVMPYNILFRFSDNFVRQILEYNIRYTLYITNDVILNINSINKIKYNIFIRCISLIFRIQRLGAKLNGKKYKVNMTKCVKCFNCVNNCFTKNITYINNQFSFNNNCVMCMKCVVNCPTNAIKFGMFDKWKVNEPYDFKSILNNNNLDGKFINKDSKKFYKYYIKYYKYLDNILK